MQDIMINERGMIHLWKDSGHSCAVEDWDLAAPGYSFGFAAPGYIFGFAAHFWVAYDEAFTSLKLALPVPL